MVGDDEAGAQAARAAARPSGVAALLGQRPAALHTIVKLRVIGRSQQLLRIDFENAARPRGAGRQLRRLRARCCPRTTRCCSPTTARAAWRTSPRMIELARAAGKPVLVDPKGNDYARYAGATVITPNRAELRRWSAPGTDEDDLRRAAQALRAELGLDALLLTRSEEGMTPVRRRRPLHVPAQAREVFDVTGAGDTVIATLAALVAAACALREAMPLANRAGGIVVGKFGTATVSYEELFA